MANKTFFNETNFAAITEGLDGLEAVSTLRTMSEEFEAEAKERTPNAIDLIREQYPDYADGGSLENREFTHNGVKYQLAVTREYDFGNISGTAELHRLEKKQAQLKKEASATTKAIREAKEAVLALHPDWKPTNVKLTLKFKR